MEKYGLTGEVRRVSMIEKQLKEAEKLGFKKCIIPENNKKLLKEKLKLDIIGVKNIKEAMKEVRTIIKNKRGGHTLKNEKGITLVVLMITVILMLILVGAGITYGTTSIGEIRLQNFSYEMQQIQGRVDATYEKMKTEKENPSYVSLNNKMMGKNITTSDEAMDTLKTVTKNRINYRTITTDNEEYYYNRVDTMYRYFSKKELDTFFDIKNATQDVIINFKTREVISVKGQKYKEMTYYRLNDI